MAEMKRIKINENERACLMVLVKYHEEDHEFCYLGFQTITEDTGLDRKQVRRAVRSLARKGLAEFRSGLTTINGEMAGSGYRCSNEGADFYVRNNPIHAAPK